MVGLIKETKNSLEKLVFERPKEIIAAIKKIIEKIDASLALSTSDVNSKDLLKNKELEDFNKIKNDLLKEVALIENDLKQVEKTETEIAAGLQDFNKQFQKAFEVMDAKRDEIRLLENKKQQMIFEREKLDMKSRDLKNQLEQIGRFIGEFADADKRRFNADKRGYI